MGTNSNLLVKDDDAQTLINLNVDTNKRERVEDDVRADVLTS